MFEGFSPATYDFLLGIAMHNERGWFNEHKQDYVNYLAAPMKAMADEVFDGFVDRASDWPFFCKVTRIYRDARRCRGTDFYKTSLWFSILPPADQWQDAPGFWFGIDRSGWDYGMGIFMPKAATMARHRAALDADPKPLAALERKLKRQKEFVLAGERYAREKEGAPRGLEDWYNLKTFSLIHQSSDVSETYDGPALVRRVVDGLTFLMPFFEYFYPLSEAGQGGLNTVLGLDALSFSEP